MANEKAGTTVNEQITDAVTQSNVKVVAESPAVALSNVYQSAAHSTGIMFENAVNSQNQQNILTQAATTQGISQIYSLDTIADAVSIAKVLNP
ncbi:antirepresssor protein RebB [Chryseobacterium sp. G0162]|uniref:RebB family R body protein n=1 Tax=unclassified Chryseobacterium TaxID=2593645 RepID=UPI000F4E65B9|nr:MULTISPECIES: RebB family R body protein [unclassified Chryseobacterium]AZB10642.1 antirepresssor protein RebB [Chryseobacterium sp. G0162]